jgi:hypothetical protein
MTHAARSDGSLKELDFRASDGLEVALLWQADDERLIVEVVDTKLGDAFRLEIAASEAGDAFQHPYAYAAFRGYSRRLPDAQAVTPWSNSNNRRCLISSGNSLSQDRAGNQ